MHYLEYFAKYCENIDDVIMNEHLSDDFIHYETLFANFWN